jgi:hypothetical protein
MGSINGPGGKVRKTSCCFFFSLALKSGPLVPIWRCYVNFRASRSEMQSESRPREDCNPKRAVGMRDFSTTLPIGRMGRTQVSM